VTTRGLMIAAPIYLQSELHLARGQIVMLIVAGACGVVFGLGWAARWITPRQAPAMMRVVLAALLVSMFALTPLGDGLATLTVSGAAFRFGGVAEPVLVGTLAAVPAVFILGTALGAVPTTARSVLTTTAPAGQQGRVFAAESVLSNALLVPSLLLVALSTDLVSARATMMLIGLIGLAVFALLEYRALRRLAADPLTMVAPAATAMPESDAV
jgi:MFS-type transporter involved in bile tolerance (Atg22 family)